jgi:hypothetical protein
VTQLVFHARLRGALVLAALLLGPGAVSRGAQPDAQARLNAWLESELAPFRSHDLAVFKAACLKLAPDGAEYWEAPRGPSWSPPDRDPHRLEREIVKLLQKRLRTPPKAPRFTLYALKAARAWPGVRGEFGDDAIQLLDSRDSAIRAEAIRILVPWPAHGYNTTSLSHVGKPRRNPQKVRALTGLLLLLEAKDGEDKLALTGKWSRFLLGFELTEAEQARLQRLGEHAVKSKNWRVRRAAVSLLAGVDFQANEARLLGAFRQEKDKRVCLATIAEVYPRRRQVKDRLAWLATGAVKPDERVRTRCRYVGMGDDGAGALAGLARARELAEKDPKHGPEIIRAAVSNAHEALRPERGVDAAAVRKALRVAAVAFSQQDHDFWIEKGLNKGLSAALLKASQALAAAVPDE